MLGLEAEVFPQFSAFFSVFSCSYIPVPQGFMFFTFPKSLCLGSRLVVGPDEILWCPGPVLIIGRPYGSSYGSPNVLCIYVDLRWEFDFSSVVKDLFLLSV